MKEQVPKFWVVFLEFSAPQVAIDKGSAICVIPMYILLLTVLLAQQTCDLPSWQLLESHLFPCPSSLDFLLILFHPGSDFQNCMRSYMYRTGSTNRFRCDDVHHCHTSDSYSQNFWDGKAIYSRNKNFLCLGICLSL